MIAPWRNAISVGTLLIAASLIAPPRSGAGEARKSLTLLTYNLAGVPNGAQNAPRHRFPAIGRLTRRYDLVLNQEVFAGAASLAGELKEKQAVAGVGVRGAPG